MSYIGNQPAALGTYATQAFTGNASLTAFTLSQAATTATILVSIDGVDQIPTTAYSVAADGVTLNFTSAPPASTISVRFLGDVVDFGEPSDDSVATAKIQDDAVTAAKLANSINTEIAANTAKVTNATHTGDVTGATALTIAVDAVDIAMLSATGTADATTFLRGDNAWTAISAEDNTPAFLARLSAAQSIANATWVKLLINTEMFDSDGTYDNSTNYRFTVPSGQAGTYVFWYGTQFNEVASGRYSSVVLYVNGTFESSHPFRSRTAYGYTIKNIQGHDNHNVTSMMKLIVGDYVEVWVAHNHGSAKNAGGDETYFGGFKVAGA